MADPLDIGLDTNEPIIVTTTHPAPTTHDKAQRQYTLSAGWVASEAGIAGSVAAESNDRFWPWSSVVTVEGTLDAGGGE